MAPSAQQARRLEALQVLVENAASVVHEEHGDGGLAELLPNEVGGVGAAPDAHLNI
eukprot:CAMPEP_0204049294 /NCGR_PEP_ID=MMETSP0360-20130528/117961_1 /ASSEMBLY_ACC=CAM_ASM_000342 /TAXON_ID=268821 /ORGANISM="Scrippsiella Hangoei, Strain SHTV-5" /LENGTH=55 /DNA_ID=CAMNT_0050996167 /DNA_START=213 /DNA_END=376 /DNA_ORIENTATION=+